MLENSVIFKPSDGNEKKTELVGLLSELGNINFEDDTWICTKKHRSFGENQNRITIYFNACPEKYKEIAKFFALLVINNGLKVQTVKAHIERLCIFLKFIYVKYSKLEVKKVNRSVINDFVTMLVNSSYSTQTKEQIYSIVYTFFSVLKYWDNMPRELPIKRKNPFWIPKNQRKSLEKYIPEEIITQLDIAFKDNRIPIVYRTIYWLLRSFPSRIFEICSMRIDCLKPSFQGEGYWVIFVPMWKQNGGYLDPEIRAIYIKDAGHGKFLLDLINEQKKNANELQDRMNIEHKGYLFSYIPEVFDSYAFKTTGEIKFKPWTDIRRVCIMKYSSVNVMFKLICKIYGIKNSKGEVFNLTSHQLRHNGITDRVYAGQDIIHIRDTTGHKSNEMVIGAYVHEQAENIIDIQKTVLNQLTREKNDSVIFKGRILYMDEDQERKILSNPRAHRLGKIGICSDMTNCKCEIFECLDCEYFIPDAEELEYFEEQLIIWERKIELFKNHLYLRENAKYNFLLHKKIVEKIRKTKFTNEG